MKRFLALALLMLLPCALRAQLSTDRPGFGIATSTVAAGVAQLEVGLPHVSYTDFGHGQDVTRYTAPALLRVGMTARSELRLSTSLLDAVSRTENRHTTRSTELGFDHVTLGAKFALTESGPTQAALVPAVSVPTDGDIRSNSTLGMTLALSQTTPSGFGLNITAGATAMPTRFDHTKRALVAIAASAALSPAVGGYVETALVVVPGDNPAYVGLGATYLVTPNLQFDVFADAGVTSAADDLLLGIGISRRF